jgi:hypothetical protein
LGVIRRTGIPDRHHHKVEWALLPVTKPSLRATYLGTNQLLFRLSNCLKITRQILLVFIAIHL